MYRYGTRAAPEAFDVQLCKLAEGLYGKRYTDPVPSWKALSKGKGKGGERAMDVDDAGEKQGESAAADAKGEHEEKEGKEEGKKTKNNININNNNNDDNDVDEEAYVTPQMFKAAAGHGHPEFLGGRQQDAMEYFQHLMEKIAKSEKDRRVPVEDRTARQFEMVMEKRVQCLEDKKVAYKEEPASAMLLVKIPTERAINQKVSVE